MQWTRFLRPRITLRGACLLILLVSGWLVWQLQPAIREETITRTIEPESLYHGNVILGTRYGVTETRRVVNSEIHLPFTAKRLRHGRVQVFNDQDVLLEQTHWSRGQLHGRHQVWHPSGQVAIQCQWRKGEPVGTWLYWLRTPAEFREDYGKAALSELYERLFDQNRRRLSEERHYRSGELTHLVRYYRDSKHVVDFQTPSDDSDGREFIRVRHMLPDGKLLHELNWKIPYHSLVLHGTALSTVERYRGQWKDGKPIGTWGYATPSGEEHTLTYLDGHITTLDGEPVDAFTKHIRGRGSDSALSLCHYQLGPNMPAFGYGSIKALRKRLNLFVHHSAIDIFDQEQAKLDEAAEASRDTRPTADFPEAAFPESSSSPDFGMRDLPVDAALTIWLKGKGLTLRYRSECFWIVSTEAAQAWQANEDILKLKLPDVLDQQLDESTGPWLIEAGQQIEHVVRTPVSLNPQAPKNDFLIKGNTGFRLPFALRDISLRSLLEILKTEHDIETTFDGTKIVVTVPEFPRASIQPPYESSSPFGP